MRERREFMKYKLALLGKTLTGLADYMGMHRNSIYFKLEGKVLTTEEEKKMMQEYAELTDKENKELWRNK